MHVAPKMGKSSPSLVVPSAPISRGTEPAHFEEDLSTSTSVQAVGRNLTELATVLSDRRTRAFTPLRAAGWATALNTAGLSQRYPSLVQNIAAGFSVGFPTISQTYSPLNHPSLITHASAFAASVTHELVTKRYLGPFSQTEVESLIGPFHTSPLSIIPKPHKPNSFRIIQNFSFPYNPVGDVSSMNAGINSDLYPCTWGTFTVVSLLFSQLPPGSQAAVRDVAEAYRSIPPSGQAQWCARRTPASYSFALTLVLASEEQRIVESSGRAQTQRAIYYAQTALVQLSSG